MRYLLAAFLLWYTQAAFAADPAGDDILMFPDTVADVQNEICMTRDPDNADAMEKAYTNWKSVNAKTLEEIEALRGKVGAKVKAHAIDPKRKVTMDERIVDYNWSATAPVSALTSFSRAAALTNDEATRGQCAQLREGWMTREPSQQLNDSRAMLQKMLDSKFPE